jgi:putative uncharacterized protein (fragment)
VLAEVDVLVDSEVTLETDSLTELFGEADSEGDVLGDVESFSVLVKSAPGITAVLPDGVVTVALPLSSTTTVEPGLTALTLSSMAFFSSGVKASGLDTTVLSAGVFIEVLVEIDVLPSVEVDALVEADMLAEIDSDSTLEADSETDVLNDTADSEADVLTEADSDSILDADVDVEVITEVI